MKAAAILLLVVAVACVVFTVVNYFAYSEAMGYADEDYNKSQRICRQASAKEGTALTKECEQASNAASYSLNSARMRWGYVQTTGIVSAVSFCLAVVLLILARRKKAGVLGMEAAGRA